MPGLLRGAARVAVAAGTATAVSNRVSRRQGERWAAQGGGSDTAPPEQAPAPAPAGPDTLAQLRELGELKQSGVLTEAEFADQKAKILGSG